MSQIKRLIDWCQRPSMIKVYWYHPNNIMVLMSVSIVLISVTAVVGLHQSFIAPTSVLHSGLYVDDLQVYQGDKIVFSDEFDNFDLEIKGWESINGAEIQGIYSHSPPKALVVRQRDRYVSHLFHDIEIVEGWKTVNYSAWVMVTDYFP